MSDAPPNVDGDSDEDSDDESGGFEAPDWLPASIAGAATALVAVALTDRDGVDVSGIESVPGWAANVIDGVTAMAFEAAEADAGFSMPDVGGDAAIVRVARGMYAKATESEESDDGGD